MHARILLGETIRAFSRLLDHEFQAALDGAELSGIESFCVDPVAGRWEFNVVLPRGIAPGPHEFRVALGRRTFHPVAIEVA